ncbi:MAG: pyridoxal phosphate-dependent aminotransferase [Planctomycetes bacterium]|nr:pyridoxal phosphate-dependent aminotransferase [Planctomycetota bacterium]
MPDCRDYKSFMVMDVLDRASELEHQGKHIIHLEIGEPDFDTPECVKDAALKAMRDNKTHYTASMGIIELREAICEDYQRKYGVEVSPEQVFVTSGTSPALLLAFSPILQNNEKVLLSNPHYACYPNFIKYAGGLPDYIDVHEENGFQYDIDELKAHVDSNTRAILINSPSNPTGQVISTENLKAIANLGITVVSDEIYHGLTYEGDAGTILQHTDDCFVLNGFSKLYAMTGWRIGYIIVPKKHANTIMKLNQSFFICAGSVAQWAAIAALKHAKEDIERMRKTYDERRKLMINKLRELGFTISVEPTGAFYVFVKAEHLSLGHDSLKLAFDILEKAHVGVTPGIDFGTKGEGHLRFSYANSVENIEEGLKRLQKYIAEDKR